MAEDGGAGRFELRGGLVRHDGALYGGTGLAVSVVAMEAATQRDVLWCSTQFVSQPFKGDTVEWEVERLAVGKRAAQLLVRASCQRADRVRRHRIDRHRRRRRAHGPVRPDAER